MKPQTILILATSTNARQLLLSGFKLAPSEIQVLKENQSAEDRAQYIDVIVPLTGNAAIKRHQDAKEMTATVPQSASTPSSLT